MSCNGYAWYKGGIVPPQPGLKHDFLTDVVRLGHAKGMRVMGYYCVGTNTFWAQSTRISATARPVLRTFPSPRRTSITCAARWRMPSCEPAWMAL